MAPPPGGPTDKLAPKLLATSPESLGTFSGWDSDVEFRFDEVISEGGSPNMGTGTGDLEKLVILSPTTEIPVVRWKRDRITVRPKEGWQPNRVYRVELLPGIVDLRRNKSDTSVVLTFATGGETPVDTVRGLVIDWPAGKPAQRALVELYLLPDSLIYRTVSDSLGRFDIGPLPRSGWTIYAVRDENQNHRLDSRESWDSTLLSPGGAEASPLWMIPRDTVGPRITGVTADDSARATISFSLPLDPAQPVTSLEVSFLRQEDSTPVALASLLPPLIDDSVQRARRTAADSVPADSAAPAMNRDVMRPSKAGVPGRNAQALTPADSAARARARAQVDSLLRTRPPLYDRLILRPAAPFVPEAHYLLEIRGIRSVSGATGDTKAVLTIPKPRALPPDSTAVRRDSLPATADSNAVAPAPRP